MRLSAKEQISFARPLLTDKDRKAVNEVLKGSVLVHGPKAKEFEAAFARYTGAPYAVSVSSCTAALHLCYFYLGIGPGDEVLVPAQTHVATAHAVELCGAKPVFVDAEKRTGNMDLDQLEAAVTPRTKAISVVHFLGMPVDMDRVMAFAQRHNLFVVEDCALSLGAYYKGTHTGLRGDAGCFSFYPAKHITTGEGGMIITRHEKMAVKLARQKAFGVDRSAGERVVPGVYDVTMLGLNYRMNEMQAALGIGQLGQSDRFLRIRQRNHQWLTRALKEIEELDFFESSNGDYRSSYYCLSALLKKSVVDKRLEIIRRFKERGIGTSVYYPQPVPHFSYYKDKYRYPESSYPVAAWISRASISLPVGPHLNLRDLRKIAVNFKEAIREVQR